MAWGRHEPENSSSEEENSEIEKGHKPEPMRRVRHLLSVRLNVTNELSI